MRTRHFFLMTLGTLILSFSLNVSSPRAESSNNLLYQAAINAARPKKPVKTVVREDGIWWGLHNGGRPTFYFTHYMKHYPATFTLAMEGCETIEVVNNGHRFESNNLIAKQSDVGGRGIAVTTQSGKCTASRKSYILYYKEDMPVENPPVLIP